MMIVYKFGENRKSSVLWFPGRTTDRKNDDLLRTEHAHYY